MKLSSLLGILRLYCISADAIFKHPTHWFNGPTADLASFTVLFWGDGDGRACSLQISKLGCSRRVSRFQRNYHFSSLLPWQTSKCSLSLWEQVAGYPNGSVLCRCSNPNHKTYLSFSNTSGNLQTIFQSLLQFTGWCTPSSTINEPRYQEYGSLGRHTGSFCHESSRQREIY